MTSKLKIQKLDPIDHILKRPDMYVGSIRPKTTEEYVAKILIQDDEPTTSEAGHSPAYDNKNISIKKESITFPPALLRIFIEALSNAIDNAQRSKEHKITPHKIKVTINAETGETTVWNDGLVIPIEQENEAYKHSMIFGELRTSTNFNDDEERMVSGRNGLGIKLTNVFSKHFQVKAVDPEKGLQFLQEWENNMRDAKAPKITKSSLKTGFTEVSWIPDFQAFGVEKYSHDILNLYLRYICDAGMLTNLTVYFNGVKLPCKTLSDYAKLYSGGSTEESVCFETKDSKVLLTPSTTNEFESISFVNGVFTIDGGKHVNSWSEAIFRPIIEHFNKPKAPQLTIKDIRPLFRLFVVCNVVNPEFTSQSKTELASPDVTTEVKKKLINQVFKWPSILEKVETIIHSKEILSLKKTESKRKTFKAIDGYEPANEAGGKHSRECTLALCEGLSAKTFAIKGMDSPLFGKSGRDWFGVYPLRGKILNVRKSNPKSISENKVITDIIQALNLTFDADYTNETVFSTLNYGRLMILTDADTDGKHIAGLIMNFIHHLFPSLLLRQDPFIVNMTTPIAKFHIKGGEEKVFYDLYEADKFYKSFPDPSKINIRYYKGLGTHLDDEIQEVFGQRVISYAKDEKTDDTFVKVFGDKMTDERKHWIAGYDEDTMRNSFIDSEKLVKGLSSFLDEDVITFSIDDCKRSIPNIMDGMKESQRKILYACFLRNLKSLMKVAQLAGFVAEKTNYHHGEQNLYDTITKMAHEFVGSNNIPLLYRGGQFGSRQQNGDDAANARYIFTRLEDITRLIFRSEDEPLLEQIIDDGDLVEPKFFVPIIPTVLINGTMGIGTGWSSNLPCFNPVEVVEKVKAWIEKREEDKVLLPWYRGFSGSITQLSKDKFISKGNLHRESEDSNNVTVTELPIGMSIQAFFDHVSKLREEKAIKSFRNYSSANSVDLVIEESPNGIKCNHETLKLTSTLNTTNIVLFDKNGKIKKYSSVDEVVAEFCEVRWEFYVKRKQMILQDLEKKLVILNNKYRFISEIITDDLIIKRKKQSVIEDEMKERDYHYDDKDGFDYLFRMQVSSFTEEKLEEIKDQIEKKQKELETCRRLTESEMWLSELDEFLKAYDKWGKEMAIADEKLKKKASSKKKVSSNKKAKTK